MESAFSLSTVSISVLAAIGGAIISFLIGVVLERYKNRRLIVVYETTSNPIGLSTKSDLWGDITVKHNGNEMDSLYLFKITIKNSSNFDADALPVNIYCDANSQILSFNAVNQDTNSIILLEAKYYSDFLNYLDDGEGFIAENPGQNFPQSLLNLQRYFSLNKNFMVDVFNRGAVCEFNILVGSIIPNTTSQIFFNIPKKSVQLLKYKSIDEVNKVKGFWAFGLGFLITIGLGTILYFIGVSKEYSIIFLGVVGGLNFFFGFAIYSLIVFIRSFFK